MAERQQHRPPMRDRLAPDDRRPPMRGGPVPGDDRRGMRGRPVPDDDRRGMRGGPVPGDDRRGMRSRPAPDDRRPPMRGGPVPGDDRRGMHGRPVPDDDRRGDDESYPGQKFGLPREGKGSVAGFGSRLVALLIDWLLCEIIAIAAFHSQFLTIGVFAAESYVLTALTGFTVGKRIVRVRVARLDGKPVGFLWALVRTVLFLCVIPPLVYDKDLRGLHDKAANTIVIRA